MSEPKKCLYCGIVFNKPVYVSRAIWETRKFCSHQCGHKYEKKQTYDKRQKEPRNCIICGKVFYRVCDADSQWAKQKHCGKVCAAASFAKAGTNYNKSKVKDMGVKKCVICGKDFVRAHRRGYKAWGEQITCGNECAITYRAQQPVKPTRRLKLVRDRKLIVYARDDFTCRRCGLRDPEIMDVDHIIPRAVAPELGNSLDNLQVLCPNCHARKTRNESQKHKNVIPRVQLLQQNPEFLKELISKN